MNPTLVNTWRDQGDDLALIAHHGTEVELNARWNASQQFLVTVADAQGLPTWGSYLRGGATARLRLVPGSCRLAMHDNAVVLKTLRFEVGNDSAVLDIVR